MPKVEIDYSNTIIYKIYCKDPSVTDVYVGHTTNFVQRKYAHKQTCNNVKSPCYNFKLYKTIRENGNWCNWEMTILNFYNCKDHLEARQKEQEYFISLGATLNSIEPLPVKNSITSSPNKIPCESQKNDNFYCKKFDYIYGAYNTTVYYNCKKCDYNTCNKKDFNKHILTAKHKKNTISTNFNQNGILEENIPKIYDCVCGKIYKERSGLWRHKHKCNGSTEKHKQIPQIDTNLIIELLKQNQELQKSLIELSKEKGITNNNSITNNKTFNLHVYLNEDCKDALNISDFVSSIKVELEDLEETGRLGYVEGVSRIINKNLGDLDQNKRPIQCSDLKRETLYIKDDDKWTKEGDETKPILKKAIKQIANENIKQISEWRKKHPDCTASDSRKNDQYLKIVSNAMAGGNKEEQDININKIVTKISKEVTIEK